ncbi:MAG: 23S rRNA (uridine(2552)-2'-O)-methyltransferase RlmE [Methylococcales bacterium]|jgi:23S rRNA (uridine2552-2'-O)-methyltransferase|nr:23S rRNA (uridine(2552)-2'-O)-methyltransferase RlmE [Methylococcales bacterium]MBT7443993.1 23S rRNA (uridine(2552)-2'-O)-methyltransferase RlmE [Methylococcales bacterium]
MAKSKSSGRWLQEHFDDEYVKRSKKEGFRSRAVYKLMEINEKDKILKPGSVAVDLGAAPGGWSQYIVKAVGEKGKVFALDILPFDSIAGVECIVGDFTENEVYENLLAQLDGQKVDVVLSDLAPNLSGIKVVDQAKMVYLLELALDFAEQVLTKNGVFLAKLFQGEGVDEFYRKVRPKFEKVVTRKPKASRSRSREVYILAKGYKL